MLAFNKYIEVTELFNQEVHAKLVFVDASEKNLLKTPFVNKYKYVLQYINITAVIVL